MSNANPFSHTSNLVGPGIVYQGQPLQNFSGDGLPAQARPGMTLGQAKERATGLIPIAAGSQHVVVLKALGTAEPVAREKIVGLKRALRETQERERVAQEAQINDPSEANAKKYLAAQSECAAAFRVLSVATARADARPTQVHVLTAQDPSAVQEAFADADHPIQWICTHDMCRGRRWPTERLMRTDHPSPAQMKSSGAVHCVGLLSDAPADATDPNGPTIGLVAPIGADGLSAAQVAQMVLSGERVPDHSGELPPPQEIQVPQKPAKK